MSTRQIKLQNRFCSKKSIMIFFIIFANAVIAQWSTDPSVNTRVTNGGLLPQIISDGNGGAYIVYQDSPALLRQLWVQRLDRHGYVRFPNNGIRVSSQERNQTPWYFLVSDSAGGVIVVFEDFHVIGEETFSAVYAQRIDSTGTKLWGDAGVEVSPLADEKAPVSACSDGESGVFVFWGEDADSNKVPELWGQRVSASGKLVWQGRGIMITDEFASFNVVYLNPAVSDEEGGAIILYSDSSGEKLQRINAQGGLLWDNGIDPSAGGQMNARGQMIEDGRGGAIIAGAGLISDSTGYHVTVRAQRVNSSGQVLWGDNGVILTELAHDLTRSVEIVVDESQNSILFWHDKRTGNFNIYAQKLDSNGEPQWMANGVPVSSFESGKTIFFSGIASDFLSGAVIIWSDNRIGGSGLWRPDALFGQRVDGNGNRLWGDTDVAISTRKVKHNSYKVISDAAGGAIVCWDEVGIASGCGIFAQQVSRNGNLGEVLPTFVSEPKRCAVPEVYFLHQNYPNPFNTEIAIRYQIPKSEIVELRIFDINGKEVIELVNRRQAAGEYEAAWNCKDKKGDDVPSGIYFYQLRAGSFVKTRKALFIK